MVPVSAVMSKPLPSGARPSACPIRYRSTKASSHRRGRRKLGGPPSEGSKLSSDYGRAKKILCHWDGLAVPAPGSVSEELCRSADHSGGPSRFYLYSRRMLTSNVY